MGFLAPRYTGAGRQRTDPGVYKQSMGMPTPSEILRRHSTGEMSDEEYRAWLPSLEAARKTATRDYFQRGKTDAIQLLNARQSAPPPPPDETDVMLKALARASTERALRGGR